MLLIVRSYDNQLLLTFLLQSVGIMGVRKEWISGVKLPLLEKR